MNVELICTLYDYNYWAHRMVWDSVLRLTDEEFRRDLSYSWGSVEAQIVHTMSAEWIWFNRLRGVSPSSMFKASDFRDRQAIRTRWDQIEADVRSYVFTLAPEKLNSTFTYKTTSGNSYVERVDGILLHVINHGTDHRAQTLGMLHHLGAPTVEQDLIFYLREMEEKNA